MSEIPNKSTANSSGSWKLAGVPAAMVVETDYWDRLITAITIVVADMWQRRVYLVEIE